MVRKRLLIAILLIISILFAYLYQYNSWNLTELGYKKIKHTMNNKQSIDLDYVSTDSGSNKGQLITYRDKDNNEYTFNKKGNYLTYIEFKNTALLNVKESVPLDSMEDLATKLVMEYIDLKDYQIDTYNYKAEGEMKIHRVIWKKYINAIPTSDEIIAKLNVAGELISIVIPNKPMLEDDIKSLAIKTPDIISKEKATSILDDWVKTREYESDEYLGYNILEDNLYYDRDNRLIYTFFIELKFNNEDNKKYTVGDTVKINAINGNIMTSDTP